MSSLLSRPPGERFSFFLFLFLFGGNGRGVSVGNRRRGGRRFTARPWMRTDKWRPSLLLLVRPSRKEERPPPAVYFCYLGECGVWCLKLECRVVRGLKGQQGTLLVSTSISLKYILNAGWEASQKRFNGAFKSEATGQNAFV